MRQPPHSEASFFEKKYQQTSDPWNFEKSSYELERYDAVLESLVGQRYRSAVEPGCSIGILTAQLAPLCDHLLAFDFSATAAKSAAARCEGMPQVEVECHELSETFAFNDFDLVVLCEIGYYFPEPVWKRLVDRMTTQLGPGSTVVAAHWLGHSEDHELSGDQVHEVLLSTPALELSHSQRFAAFRLEKWTRR